MGELSSGRQPREPIMSETATASVILPQATVKSTLWSQVVLSGTSPNSFLLSVSRVATSHYLVIHPSFLSPPPSVFILGM